MTSRSNRVTSGGEDCSLRTVSALRRSHRSAIGSTLEAGTWAAERVRHIHTPKDLRNGTRSPGGHPACAHDVLQHRGGRRVRPGKNASVRRVPTPIQGVEAAEAHSTRHVRELRRGAGSGQRPTMSPPSPRGRGSKRAPAAMPTSLPAGSCRARPAPTRTLVFDEGRRRRRPPCATCSGWDGLCGPGRLGRPPTPRKAGLVRGETRSGRGVPRALRRRSSASPERRRRRASSRRRGARVSARGHARRRANARERRGEDGTARRRGSTGAPEETSVGGKVPRRDTAHLQTGRNWTARYLPATGTFQRSLTFSDIEVRGGTLLESALHSCTAKRCTAIGPSPSDANVPSHTKKTYSID